MARRTKAQIEVAKRAKMVATAPNGEGNSPCATQTLAADHLSGSMRVEGITQEPWRNNLIDQLAIRRNWDISPEQRKRILDNQVRIASSENMLPVDVTRAFRTILDAERLDQDRLLALIDQQSKSSRPQSPGTTVNVQINQAEAALFSAVDAAAARASRQHLIERGEITPETPTEAQADVGESRPGYHPK